MHVLRTPEERFANLPGFPFEPHCTDVADGEGRDYQPPFAYPGKIKRVTFELASRPTEDRRDESERESRAAMARQ